MPKITPTQMLKWYLVNGWQFGCGCCPNWSDCTLWQKQHWKWTDQDRKYCIKGKMAWIKSQMSK